MSDETTGQTAPAPEPASQPDPTTRPDDYQAPVEETLEEAAPEPVSPPDDSEEIDFDGEKYKVPKKLKDGFLMQKDYTKKTQEVAQQRQQVEQYHQYVTQQAQVAQQHAVEIGQVYNLNHRLAQYQQVDWQKLEAEDPFRAASLHREYSLARDHRDQLLQRVQTREQQRVAGQQQAFDTQYQRTNAQLARDIPNWNQETANEIAGYLRENGIDEPTLRQIAINPAAVKLAHKALLGHKLSQARQEAARTAEPKPEIKPLEKPSGAGARSAVNLATADMDTYVRERKKQIAARNS